MLHTCRLGWYFESFLDGGDGAVKVGITSGEYAAENTVEEHVRLLVGKLLQYRAPEAPYAARGVVGDRQFPEDVLEAPGRRRGRRRRRRRRRRHLQQLQVLRPVLLVVRVVLHLRRVVATARAIDERLSTRRLRAYSVTSIAGRTVPIRFRRPRGPWHRFFVSRPELTPGPALTRVIYLCLSHSRSSCSRHSITVTCSPCFDLIAPGQHLCRGEIRGLTAAVARAARQFYLTGTTAMERY